VRLTRDALFNIFLLLNSSYCKNLADFDETAG
jgi:hypothetical protein